MASALTAATSVVASETDQKSKQSKISPALIIAAQPGSPYRAQLISRDAIAVKLADVAVETMKAISNERRLCLEKNKIGTGVYYRVDYLQALKKMGEAGKKRLDDMVNKDLFFHGFMPSKFFHYVPDASSYTGNLPEYYQLDAGKSASQGLDALRKGVTLLGCGETCQIAYYTAVRAVLGNEKFDHLFGLKAKWPLMVGSGRQLPKEYFNPFNSIIDSPKLEKIQDVKKGQIIGFVGATGYQAKHLCGNGVNYTAMCDEEGTKPKFTGLSFTSKTQYGVAETLLDSFNEDPLDPREMLSQTVCEKLYADLKPQFKLANAQLKHVKLTMDQFQEQGGGKFVVGTGMTFEIDRIVTLAKLSIPEACKQLAKWQEIDVIAFGNNNK